MDVEELQTKVSPCGQTESYRDAIIQTWLVCDMVSLSLVKLSILDNW